MNTWLKCLIIIAFLCLAVKMAPKFTAAEPEPFNIPDPCEMAELANDWLEYAD